MAAFDFPTSPADGQVYTANGVTFVWSAADTAWKGQGSQVPLTNKMKLTVMLASGDYVPPPGLKFVDVELIGTGGNGGVAALTAAGQSSAGSGGGGGGYCRKLYAASDLAASEPVVIGAIAGGSGGNGGDSTFKGLVAGGGQGGGTVAAGTTLAQASAGVAGTATGGDINIPGGNGESGIRACHGSAPAGQRGPGGNTALSAKTGGVIVATAALGGPGGNFPGGGGGGGANGQSIATASSGGFGALGVAIFTEYYYDADEFTAAGGELWSDWTPAPTFSGGKVGMTFGNLWGRVCKRGKKVDVWFDVTLTNKGSSTGSFWLEALPYPSAVVMTNLSFSGSVSYARNIAASTGVGFGCYVPPGVSYISITQIVPTGTDMQGIPNTAITNTSRFIGHVSYEAAS